MSEARMSERRGVEVVGWKPEPVRDDPRVGEFFLDVDGDLRMVTDNGNSVVIAGYDAGMVFEGVAGRHVRVRIEVLGLYEE